MVLCAIVEQTGRLEVKNKGKIRHEGIISQLIASGVSTVTIETQDDMLVPEPVQEKPQEIKAPPPPRPKPPPLPKLRLEDILEPEDEPETVDATDMIDLSDAIDLSDDTVSEKHLVSENEEVEAAEQLIIECKKTHHDIVDKLQKNVPIDVSSTRALVNDVHDNLVRNPDALLCLSMIRNEGQYVTNHAMHVAILLCHFARFLGMTEEECQRMALIGYFFDIGMLKVPKDILYKQGRPTLEEQELIQSHVQHSLDLLAPLNLGQDVMLAIEQHHERLDGSGYPKGLKGEDIHIYSRMLAIVDCYEAMTTNRPFQKKSSPAAALKLISDTRYGYDQKLALKFIRCMGVYPIGSLVILSNQRIGMVIKHNSKSALTPTVKVFYSISSNEYIEQTDIDLSSPSCKLKIEQPTLPEHYRLDLKQLSF
jgi:HD-GYP domain-containing protein (c-di-GMP phosphodiesterase class II)